MPGIVSINGYPRRIEHDFMAVRDVLKLAHADERRHHLVEIPPGPKAKPIEHWNPEAAVHVVNGSRWKTIQ